MDLQSALAGIRQHITPPAPRPTPRPSPKPKQAKTRPVRRLAVGSFDFGRKAVDTTGAVGRHSESRPPPEHEPNFAERHFAVQHGTHVPRTMTARQRRLWSKNEV